ncbi:Small integral membrane protein 19, partial [Dryobates pubescens]
FAPLRRNKRRIMRIFTLPPAAETPPEPNFYDSMKKIRLRQQLEMYSIARKYEQQQQQPPKQTESVQLSVE